MCIMPLQMSGYLLQRPSSGTANVNEHIKINTTRNHPKIIAYVMKSLTIILIGQFALFL